jgi:hypothetical protein
MLIPAITGLHHTRHFVVVEFHLFVCPEPGLVNWLCLHTVGEKTVFLPHVQAIAGWHTHTLAVRCGRVRSIIGVHAGETGKSGVPILRYIYKV